MWDHHLLKSGQVVARVALTTLDHILLTAREHIHMGHVRRGTKGRNAFVLRLVGW